MKNLEEAFDRHEKFTAWIFGEALLLYQSHEAVSVGKRKYSFNPSSRSCANNVPLPVPQRELSAGFNSEKYILFLFYLHKINKNKKNKHTAMMVHFLLGEDIHHIIVIGKGDQSSNIFIEMKSYFGPLHYLR
jgi:hypothetical protein